MDFQYLIYALEVAKTKSINQASVNLMVSQSNLSRDIKKLEEQIGIKIFNRTSFGVEITPDGEQFLVHASNIISEYNLMNDIKSDVKNQIFSICVPKGNYITNAFMNFVDCLDKSKTLDINYKESSSIGAIGEVLYHGFNLGIIRYAESNRQLMNSYFDQHGLGHKRINKFEYNVVVSKYDPLALKEEVTLKDLDNYIEITHGDPYLPKIKDADLKNESSSRSIKVYDSMGQLTMVSKISGSYMIVYPLDEVTLEKYNLIQKEVKGITELSYDTLIFRKDYKFTKLDFLFIHKLEEQIKHKNK